MYPKTFVASCDERSMSISSCPSSNLIPPSTDIPSLEEIQRDIMNLKRFPLKGIEAYPQDGSMFEWCARIEGLMGTVWEDGIFYLSLSFDEEFNIKPPAVHFITIPFHPNVDDKDGSIAITNESWIIGGTLSSLLLSLQVLLSNPELERACIRNHSAAELLSRAPHTFKQTVMDCVLASIRTDGGFPDNVKSSVVMESAQNERTNVEVEGKEGNKGRSESISISFTDYHTLWRGIATSIVSYDHHRESDLLKLQEKDRYFIRAHIKDDIGLLPMKKRQQSYLALKHGILHRGGSGHSFSKPEHHDTEDYMYEEDKEIAEHIKWSQSNHKEEHGT